MLSSEIVLDAPRVREASFDIDLMGREGGERS